MPAFRTGHPRCRLVLTADRSQAAGGHQIVWDAADYDDVAMWDGVGSIVLDRDGLWRITACITRAAQTTTQAALVRPRVNGANVAEGRTPGATTLVVASTTVTLELAAGDSIDALVQLTTTISANLNQNFSYLEVIREGPKRWT